MTVEQIFIAFDGKRFKTEEECVRYEKSINKVQDVIPALRKVQTICDKQNHCQECVFYNSSIEECIFTGDVPAWWHLSKIDKRIGG